MGDLGKPEDLGPLAVYLASDASRYMTGVALVIDGGYTLWHYGESIVDLWQTTRGALFLDG